MHRKVPTALWQMSGRTTSNTFFLILLSIQLSRTKWTNNATLYTYYSENKKGQATGENVVCCNVFCAQNLLSDLEEYVFIILS